MCLKLGGHPIKILTQSLTIFNALLKYWHADLSCCYNQHEPASIVTASLWLKNEANRPRSVTPLSVIREKNVCFVLEYFLLFRDGNFFELIKTDVKFRNLGVRTLTTWTVMVLEE